MTSKAISHRSPDPLLDEPALRAIGRALARVLRPGDVVGLSGPLGAGKTTLARAILHALGIAGEVPSPSFAIVQPYDTLTPPVAHVDLYRLDGPADLAELGLEEWRVDGALLIEWPDRLGSLFADRLDLTLEPSGDGQRRLTATVPPSWEGRWPPRP